MVWITNLARCYDLSALKWEHSNNMRSKKNSQNMTVEIVEFD